MSMILTIKKPGLSGFGRKIDRGTKSKAVSGCRVFCINEYSKHKRDKFSVKGSAKVEFTGIVCALAMLVVFFGAFYLYQVNDLATKGYEIKEIEKQIKELKKTNEENKIKEVEFKSMYNIEKATQDLNLVSSDKVSYLEINDNVAMNVK